MQGHKSGIEQTQALAEPPLSLRISDTPVQMGGTEESARSDALPRYQKRQVT